MGLFDSSFRYDHWDSHNLLHRSCGYKTISRVARRRVDLDRLPPLVQALSNLRLPLLVDSLANQHNQLQTRFLVAVVRLVRILHQQLQQAAVSGRSGKILLLNRIRLVLARGYLVLLISSSSSSSRVQGLVHLDSSSSSSSRREPQELVSLEVAAGRLGRMPIRQNPLVLLVNVGILSTFTDLCADFDISASAFGTTSAFGQPQQQPAASTGLFGQPQQQNTGAFGVLGKILFYMSHRNLICLCSQQCC